jgi:hypothetical protein
MKLNNAPLNVTENTTSHYASLLVNNIKSRNHENCYKPTEQIPQTNIVKITYSKKLTYKNPNLETKKTDKTGVNIYTSYANDTLYNNLMTKTNNNSNSKNRALENKLHQEKTGNNNPVVLVDKNKR